MVNVYIYVLAEPKAPKSRTYKYRYALGTGDKKVEGAGIVLYDGMNTPTRHRATLEATIAAFSRMNKPAIIELYTNDWYIVNGHRDMPEWIRNGWRRSRGEPLRNDDLWKRLHELEAPHAVRCHYEDTKEYFK